MSMSLTSGSLASPIRATMCRVAFGHSHAEIGRGDANTVRIALPILAGAPDECLALALERPETRGGFSVFRTAGGLAGFAVAAPALDLEIAATELYRELFTIADGLHLHRIWNYVPQINDVVDGLENYRRFCRGRSLAFEKRFGRDFHVRLPAASGVGALAGPLVVAFVAGRTAPRHFENPRQVPAFAYPAQYGPRPPSFSRATLVEDAAHGRQLYISGTAAIHGHATVAAGDLGAQLEATVENLRTIGATAGVGSELGAGSVWRRSFKVYLRHAADLARTQAHLQRSLLRPGDEVSYLQADLCRSDLLVEIEAALEAR